MDYFKFTCPHCHTRVGTTPDTSGHQINCPNCEGEVIIPPAPEDPSLVPAGIAATTPPPEAASVDEAEQTIMLRRSDFADAPVTPIADGNVDHFDGPAVPETIKELESDNPFSTPLAAAAPAPMVKAKTEAAAPAATVNKSDVAPPSGAPPVIAKTGTSIKAITPQLKLQLLTEARERIATEDKWISGKTSRGTPILAARKEGDRTIAEHVGSATATQHSLIGALLLGMELRNVAMSAIGRSALLHDDIERTAAAVLDPTAIAGTAAKADLTELSHANCLAVLDKLIETLSGQIKPAARMASATTAGSGAEDPVNALLLRDDDKVSAAEVLRVLNDEIKSLRQRLETLEKK